MIILLFIFYVSVTYSYEVIPGCVPKMTPVNGTHCRIEYEHCFKNLNPGHLADLSSYGQMSSPWFSSFTTVSNNLVNINSVCGELRNIYLYIDRVAALSFSYTPDDFKKTIQDYMCYSGNNVTLNMIQFREERPDQHCLTL